MGRFIVLLAVFVAAVIFTTAHITGDVGPKKQSIVVEREPLHLHPADEADTAHSRFTQPGVLAYQPANGDPCFALQVRVQIPQSPRRPCDVLVMVANSAAQAGPPWLASAQIADGIIEKLRADDRVSLWTISTPDQATTCLTRQFIAATDHDNLKQAFKTLTTRHFPAGDTDLKSGLRQAIDSFDGQVETRQRIILFLGDGQSTHNPITSAERLALCREMMDRKIIFITVPLGLHLDANNLHGLATGTGGAVVRVDLGTEKLDAAVAQLERTMTEPVFYPTRLQLPAEVTESYPRKLPPLRGDAPTLVVGRMKAPARFAYQLDGRVPGRPQPLSFSITEAVRPAELDNYFLVSMVNQLLRASDEPTLIRADRALAFAFEQNRLNHMELLASGQLAVRENHLAIAEQLFNEAKQLVPHDAQARAGLKLVDDLRAGRLTPEAIRRLLDNRKMDKVSKTDGKVRWGVDLVQVARLDANDADAGDRAAPIEGNDLLRQQRDRLIVEEQRMTQLVDDNLRQARRELTSSPDAALDRLRTTLHRLRDHPDLGDKLRTALMQNVEAALFKLTTDGQALKLREAQRRQVLEQLQKNRRLQEQRQTEEERTAAQFQSFRNIITVARMEEKSRQEVVEGLTRMQEEARLRGQAPPVVTQAAYDQLQAAYNLNKYDDLRKRREKSFLELYLSVEKSHVPFSDEPGIYYPPLTMWNALTQLRKEKYEVFTIPDSEDGRREANSIAKLLEQKIDMKDFQNPMSLKEALQLLAEKFAAGGRELPILVDAEAFKAENPDAPDIYDAPVKFPPFPRMMSLNTALRLALSFVPEGNATYLIRRNFIEITTIERQTQERVLRVYSVGDLVIPINPSSMFGGFGQLGQFGGPGFGQVGQFGAPGLAQFGQLGQFGAPAFGQFGQFGAPGFGQLGQFGQFGAPGFGQLGQFGVPGFGQFGQLGGGFNFAGGPYQGGFNGAFGQVGAAQAADLINVITRLVAPGEWFVTPQPNPFQFGFPGLQGNIGGGNFGLVGGGAPPVPVGQGGPANIQNANTIEYFPPALALIVRSPSRLHYSDAGGIFGKTKRPLNDPFAQAVNERGLDLVQAPAKNGKVQVADAGAAGKLDPETLWRDALARGDVEPGLIIAVTDFLFEAGQPAHAAEFLKANLRKGIVVRPWVYEALAIALERSGGDPGEIRRARLSAIALDPQDAAGFLDAAGALARHKEWNRALAFCRQAALLEPNIPDAYVNALTYAEQSRDGEAMLWAVERLLSHDWPEDNQQLQLLAQTRSETLAELLQLDQRAADADRLRESLRRLQRRDLIVRLSWENGSQPSDVELTVIEPCGSVASFQQRQTAGGGTFLANNLAQLNRISYTAAEAFPGEYIINVRRGWGQPLGNRVRVEIIQHAGTPQESKRIETVAIDQPAVLRINLENGRRTMLASVPATTQRTHTALAALETPGAVLTKLRELAAPDFSGSRNETPRLQGGSGTPGAKISAGPLNRRQPEHVAVQRAIPSSLNNGLAFNAQTAVSADGRYVRLSMSPVFQRGEAGKVQPK